MAIKILGNIKSLTDTLYLKLTDIVKSTSNNLNNKTSASDDQVPSEKAVATALEGKVDKIVGKGLSTKDYTAEEKTKLEGIEAGANKTVVDSSLSDSSEHPVQNKVINTALSGKQNTLTAGTNIEISNNIISAVDTQYDNATDSTDGLMSSNDKSKLDSISEYANNYSLPEATTTSLGGIKVGSNLSITDDGTLSATDTLYNDATQSAHGLMSASDKTKLDGIATGATNVVVDSELSSTSTNALQNKIIKANLDTKQDKINDLDTIRSGASAGATAVQQSGLTSALNNALSNYTTTSALTGLLDAKQNVIEDLDTIKSGAFAGATALQPSDLDNYYTKTQVDNEITGNVVNDLTSTNATTSALSAAQGAALKTQIDNLVSRNLGIKVVGELPTTNINPAYIYLKSNGASDDNAYDEYVYFENKWELIGTRQVDVSTKVEQGEVTSQLEFTFIDSEDTLATIQAKGGEYATLELGDLYVEDVTSSTV